MTLSTDVSTVYFVCFQQTVAKQHEEFSLNSFIINRIPTGVVLIFFIRESLGMHNIFFRIFTYILTLSRLYQTSTLDRIHLTQ